MRLPTHRWIRRTALATANSPAALLLVTATALIGCGGDTTAPAVRAPEPPNPGLALVWPLSGTDAEGADSIHSPYGPRQIGYRDFHAGVDLPAPLGKQVRAVMDGTVAQVRSWDGSSTGAGNAILIHHDDGRSTAYLHLHTTTVDAGDRVEAGEAIGTVGRTGATYPHLHLGYMLGLPGNSVDERRSRNPLELLPHDAPDQLASPAYPDSHTVRLQIPLQSMTVRSIALHGSETVRTLDYYDVVALGSVPRNEAVHGGIRITTEAPTAGRFPLTLEVTPPEYRLERVVVLDIHGDTITDSTPPD